MLKPLGTKKESTVLHRTCSSCHLSQRPVSNGSITSWIFRSDTCTCDPAIAAHRTAAERVLGLESTSFPKVDTKYEILQLIGKGGMGEVYKARNVDTDTILALKILSKDLSTDSQAIKRFRQEATSAAKLSSPHIASIYAHGVTPDGTPYLVMEYVDGESLADLIQRSKKLGFEVAVSIFSQLCDALDHAHQNGIIHRDLKPSNVLVVSNETGFSVKLVDFGIVKVQLDARPTFEITETGDVLGSPNYMSPEQCLGTAVDFRSDIYSLGCVAYEVLTGVAPFAGGSPIHVIAKQLTEQPMRFHETDSSLLMEHPAALEEIVFRCLEKDPRRRYSHVADLKKDLARVSPDMALIPKSAVKTLFQPGWGRLETFFLNLTLVILSCLSLLQSAAVLTIHFAGTLLILLSLFYAYSIALLLKQHAKLPIPGLKCRELSIVMLAVGFFAIFFHLLLVVGRAIYLAPVVSILNDSNCFLIAGFSLVVSGSIGLLIGGCMALHFMTERAHAGSYFVRLAMLMSLVPPPLMLGFFCFFSPGYIDPLLINQPGVITLALMMLWLCGSVLIVNHRWTNKNSHLLTCFLAFCTLPILSWIAFGPAILAVREMVHLPSAIPINLPALLCGIVGLSCFSLYLNRKIPKRPGTAFALSLPLAFFVFSFSINYLDPILKGHALWITGGLMGWLICGVPVLSRDCWAKNVTARLLVVITFTGPLLVWLMIAPGYMLIKSVIGQHCP